MANTLKVGSTGRYGSRYGVGIRRKLLKVEPTQYQKHTCPNCGSPNVKRESRGIFNCRKCSHAFVGGAYIPQTLAGTIIHKMVSQKVFSGESAQTLEKAIEAPAITPRETDPKVLEKREKRRAKKEQAQAAVEGQEEVQEGVQEEVQEDLESGEEN